MGLPSKQERHRAWDQSRLNSFLNPSQGKETVSQIGGQAMHSVSIGTSYGDEMKGRTSRRGRKPPDFAGVEVSGPASSESSCGRSIFESPRLEVVSMVSTASSVSVEVNCESSRSSVCACRRDWSKDDSPIGS